MSAAKFKINKISYIGRFLSLTLLIPLAVLSGLSLLLFVIFENIYKYTYWIFISALDRLKKIFAFKGDDDGE